MQAKIVVRNPFVVMAAAVVIAGGCVTVPTPGELDAQFKAESKARPLGALANGTRTRYSLGTENEQGHLAWRHDWWDYCGKS